MKKVPKAKISREMVVNAAFEITRREGIENVNARTVSEALGCSTQPVMYHFSKIEELKLAVCDVADIYHSEYLMDIGNTRGDIMHVIWLNYIRFAAVEPNLFRLLFQSGYAAGNSLIEMIDSEGLRPILEMTSRDMGMELWQIKEVFLTMALFAHGYAGMLANNTLKFDEGAVAEHLERTFSGAVLAMSDDGE